MMQEVRQPTQDPGWVLTHEGYNVLTENAVESRFALGNGFLGMRAVSRGPTWVSWQGYVRWARGRAATSRASSTDLTPCRQCPHWCPSRTGRE